MSELRWNPFLGTWTMVASNRQNRPTLPTQNCPFCPGSPNVPSQYEVLTYNNDFPALVLNPQSLSITSHPLFRSAPNYGKTEVILYSSQHELSFCDLSLEHILKVIDLWKQRYAELSQDPNIQYIFIFENRGEIVGVTIHHPHGQLYAYPFIPQKIQVELQQSKQYFAENKSCLFCDYLQAEIRDKQRIVLATEHFTSMIPYFCEYPYGIMIIPNRHYGNLLAMTSQEQIDLAYQLKTITTAFDKLFDKKFPYMMCLHQCPTHQPETKSYYHFHIEFYPPLRDANRIKYNASSETGAWAAANTRLVEETAQEFREAIQKIN
ncbi:MAG: galactose-1-phosphate uridylyltransferase [Bacteroidia bacterium]|nr:galactose-1-phosphate uridylyltransferase [Bacteroidia bacterium]